MHCIQQAVEGMFFGVCKLFLFIWDMHVTAVNREFHADFELDEIYYYKSDALANVFWTTRMHNSIAHGLSIWLEHPFLVCDFFYTFTHSLIDVEDTNFRIFNILCGQKNRSSWSEHKCRTDESIWVWLREDCEQCSDFNTNS